MIVYVLTAVNAVILGVVAYLFYAFRQAVDASGVKQIDDYLHELEGSVAQLTEQFERTSTKISKDLLRKTTELQSLIGECDTKLAQASRIRLPEPNRVTRAEDVRPRGGFEAELPAELPTSEDIEAPSFRDTLVSEQALPAPNEAPAAFSRPASAPVLASASAIEAPVAAAPSAAEAESGGRMGASQAAPTAESAAPAARLNANSVNAGLTAEPASNGAAPANAGAVRQPQNGVSAQGQIQGLAAVAAAQSEASPAPQASVGAPAITRPSTTAAPGSSAPAGSRRMSAAELLATKPAPAGQTPTPAANAQPPAAARRAEPLPEAFVPGLGGQDAVPGAGAQPNDKYRLIFLLASEGMDSANIAKHTNLTRGEVEMLLDLRRQGKI